MLIAKSQHQRRRVANTNYWYCWTSAGLQQEGLAVASIAQDDPSPLPGMHRNPMHFHHRQMDRQMDTDIVA